MVRRLFLGIDIGTSAVKASVTDGDQVEVASSSSLLRTVRKHHGWSEQTVEQWRRAVIEAVTSLWKGGQVESRAVCGVGLTGQMHGAVLLGMDCRPLYPVILWNDGRAEQEATWLSGEFPDLPGEVGVLPMAGLTGPKLLWLKRHEPEIIEQTRWILSPKDYIRYLLTGEIITDYSDAAGTWLLDQQRRKWSAEAVKAVGLAPSQLPEIVESTSVSGMLTSEMAELLGLQSGLPVAGGGGDTPVGAVGLGCVSEGQGIVSLGTSAHIFSPTASYRPAVDSVVHSFCHSLPNLWYQMGAMLNGASVFAWITSLFGENTQDADERVCRNYRGPGKGLFLPYLTGERTPHNDPLARGVLFGVSPITDKVALYQLVMEGVAFSIADGRDALVNSGTRIEQAAISGGGANSRIWAQIISSVLAIPIIRYRGKGGGPAAGAARLARIAIDGLQPKESCGEPEIEEVLEPDKEYMGQYQENHERYKSLYRQLRSEFRGIEGD